MPKDKEKLYQIYQAVLSMALTWAFVLVLNDYYTLKVNILLTAVLSFIPSILVYLFYLNRKYVISYILAACIFPLLALIFWVFKLNPIKIMNGLINWCQIYDGSESLYKQPYAILTVFGIAIAGSILFYLVTMNQTTKKVLAVIILVALVVLCIRKINVNKAVVGICIFYILTIIIELYGTVYSKKMGRQDKKEGILYLAPICLLLAVLSISLPSGPEPIKWSGIKNVYYRMKEQIEIWQTDISFYFDHGNSEFFLSLSGYSEDGGDLSNRALKKDNKVAMKVSGAQKGSHVYLIGSVSDIYTGHSWEKSREDYISGEKEYMLDYAEMLLALTRQDLTTLEDNYFLKRKVLKIKYNNIKTKTLFYPLMTYDYDVDSGYKKLVDDASQITFEKPCGKGTEYHDIYYDMNLQGDAFCQMLRESDSFSYDQAGVIKAKTKDYILSEMVNHDGDNLLLYGSIYDLMEKRTELIKSKYINLPDTLPDRVRELADSITKNYNTKYDKLKAIEAYLLSYNYTLQPKETPVNKDFTDYFLFDSKEGYCTSFATAMAVLGRCIGVPTRYVEGFVVDCNEEDQNGHYPVKNSQAHAWAEAYFEGVGWIPFEATASYYDIRYTKWQEVVKQDKVVGSGAYYNGQGQNPSQMYHPEVQEVKKPEKTDYSGAINVLIIFFASLVSLLLVVLIYYYILKLRYRKALRAADYSGKMYLRFLRILEYLKEQGFTLGQQETIQMFSIRLKNHFKYGDISFKEVADIYMKYRYAERPVTSEEWDKVDAYCKGLSEKRKAEDKWWKVWFGEFIFLIQADRQWKHRYNNI